jgi:cell division protein FtsZ
LLKLTTRDKTPLTFANAFEIVDDVLYTGVQGVTDLIVRPGLINLDFADVKTIMSNTGRARLGTGEAEGENRAMKAAEAALHHPLLEDVDISGAKRVLINVTGGSDLSLFEVNQISQMISEEADPDANIIFGTTLSEDMKGRVRVSLFVTELSNQTDAKPSSPKPKRTAEVRHITLPYIIFVCV